MTAVKPATTTFALIGDILSQSAIDGTDRGRYAQAVVDLLHEGTDCLRCFRCRARVACPDQLSHLIAAVLPGTRRRGRRSVVLSILCQPTSEFQRSNTPAVLTDRADARLTFGDVFPERRDAMVHGSTFRTQRVSRLQCDEAEAAILPVWRQWRVVDHCIERHASAFNHLGPRPSPRAIFTLRRGRVRGSIAG